MLRPVANGLVHGALGNAKSLAGDADTATVKGLHGKAETFAQLTELTILRNTAVFENKFSGGTSTDTHFLLLLANTETGVGLLYDKGSVMAIMMNTLA